LSKGGISYHGSTLPIRLKCFIADAPARVFLIIEALHPIDHALNVKFLVHDVKVIFFMVSSILFVRKNIPQF